MHFRYGKDRNNTVPWTLTDVSLKLEADSTHGIVGESGSGRSTLIRVLDGLLHHRLSPRLGP